MTKVWLYSVASLFSLGVLLGARHLIGGAGAQFMGESIGLVIVLLSCQICFHLNGIDELLVDSKPQVFIQKILKSAGAGLLIAALLFFIFPRLSPGYAAAAASACFLMFGLVVLRPIARSIARIGDPAGTIIVGSEEMARKLYNEIIEREAPENIRIVRYQDLSRFAEQENISRVVVADHDIESEPAATQILIDLKLRGVRVESALESFEKASQKIWIEGLSAERLIFANGFCPSKCHLIVKRALDLLLSVVLLMCAAPIMALVSIVIK